MHDRTKTNSNLVGRKLGISNNIYLWSNTMNLEKLIGHKISYHWGGKIRQGKLVRIKSGVLIIEDINQKEANNQSGGIR